MPKRSYRRKTNKRRKSYKRRAYRKRRSTRRHGNQLSGQKGPFPNTLYVKLVFAQTVSITGAGGVPATKSYRFNSPWDPDISGIGLAGRWYSNLVGANGPYRSYRVHAAGIASTFTMITASANVSGRVGVYLHEDTAQPITSSSTMESIMSLKNLSSKPIAGASFQTGFQPTVYKKMKIKTLASVKDIKDNSDLSAAYNGLPNNGFNAQVFYVQNNPNTTATFEVNTRITYYCELFDLSQPNL